MAGRNTKCFIFCTTLCQQLGGLFSTLFKVSALFMIFLGLGACRKEINPDAYKSQVDYQIAENAAIEAGKALKDAEDRFLAVQKLYKEAKADPRRPTIEKEKTNYFASRDSLALAYRNYLYAQYQKRYKANDGQKRALIQMFHVEQK